MNDDTTFTGLDEMEGNENTMTKTCTQVVSCAVGEDRLERRRQSLRAKLERESYEHKQQLEGFFSRSFRNLLKGF
jgi:hypothetical protein